MVDSLVQRKTAEYPAENGACPRLTSSAEGPGWIEGYAAIFDNVDSQGDVIRRGAFAKTVRERVPAGRVKMMVVHFANGGSTMEVIGTVTQAREDARGLWIHADLSSDATAQEARIKVFERHVLGLSIGYVPIRRAEIAVDGRPAMELKEIKLLEVTLTPFPSNELAGVTAAKQECGARSAECGVKSGASPASRVSRGTATMTRWRLAVARRRLTMARLGLERD